MGKFETSLAEGQHKLLTAISGRWEGIAKTWFEGDEPVDESAITGSIRPALDGRFALHEYSGAFQGKPLNGIAIYGYDLRVNEWQSVLMDTFHMSTGIMFLKGGSTEDITFTGSYSSLEPEPQTWGWRIELKQEHPDQLLITSYNITPAGESARAVEINYHRIS
ncbi:MAG: DUF1579 domain-containing protein [Chitinophagaceae bacterium]|nr:MAG: DUF1579 domain-containing protein [Chitinophagaceae bacterium]